MWVQNFLHFNATFINRLILQNQQDLLNLLWLLLCYKQALLNTFHKSMAWKRMNFFICNTFHNTTIVSHTSEFHWMSFKPFCAISAKCTQLVLPVGPSSLSGSGGKGRTKLTPDKCNPLFKCNL